MHAPSSDAADLADALARGRLCLAEIAQLREAELESLFALATRLLDAQQVDSAITLLAALCTLFPYDARYWRALAIALHRGGEPRLAIAAYGVALAAEPGHRLTQVYLAQARTQLGDPAGPAALAALAVAANDAASAHARRCLAVQRPAAAPAVAAAPPPAVLLTAGDGRRLPLADGRYAPGAASAEAAPESETTVRFLRPTPARHPPDVSHTDTAIVARGAPRALADDASHSATARVARSPEVAVARRRSGLALTGDITLTDIVRP